MLIDLVASTVSPALAVLAQAGAPGEELGEPDFRAHVWLAYAMVLILLGLFSVWTLLKLRQVQGRVDHLRERFDKAHPESGEPGPS